MTKRTAARPGPFRSDSQLARMDDAQLLEYLADLADQLEPVNADQEALWAARIAVYREGRRREPPIKYGQMAEAARVSEIAIFNKLRQLEDREAADSANA